jgi:DNA-binding protein YbaB
VAAVADASRAAQALQSERMGGVTGGIDLSAFGLG